MYFIIPFRDLAFCTLQFNISPELKSTFTKTQNQLLDISSHRAPILLNASFRCHYTVNFFGEKNDLGLEFTENISGS